MLLKIETEKKIKTIEFNGAFRSITNVYKLVVEATGYKDNCFELYSKDELNSLIPIHNQFDLDDFYRKSTDKACATLFVKCTATRESGSDFIQADDQDFIHVASPETSIGDCIAYNSNITNGRASLTGNNQDYLAKAEQHALQVSPNQLSLDSTRASNQHSFLKISKAANSNIVKNTKDEYCQGISNISQAHFNKNQNNEEFDKLSGQYTNNEVSVQSKKLAMDHQTLARQSKNDLFVNSRLQALESQVLMLTDLLSRKLETSKSNSKISLTIPPQESNSYQISTNHVVSCSNCKITPIIGKRFSCMVCPDLDLCEKCEGLSEHKHPMVRCISQMAPDHLAHISKKYERACRRKNSDTEEVEMKVSLRFINERNKKNKKIDKFRNHIDTNTQNNLKKEDRFLAKAVEEDLKQKKSLIQFMLNSNDQAYIDEYMNQLSELPFDEFVIGVAKKHDQLNF
jgi:hypothetical protein